MQQLQLNGEIEWKRWVDKRTADKREEEQDEGGVGDTIQDKNEGMMFNGFNNLTHPAEEEFSDESLFGEDRIEDLIERKNNLLRGMLPNKS